MQPTWITPEKLPTLISDRTNGQALLVNHWATWCDACVDELPSLSRLFDEYGENIRFLFLSWDRLDPQDTEELSLYSISDLIEEHGLYFEHLVFRGTSEELFEGLALDDEVVPQTFVYDQSGDLQFHHVGSIDEDGKVDELEELLEQLTS